MKEIVLPYRQFNLKNIRMDKKIKIWICIALLIGLLSGYSYAFADEFTEETADEAAAAAEEAAEAAVEAAEANIECAKGFPAFLGTVIDVTDFSSYWVDIFKKNFCHLEDIFEVDDRIDEIFAEIRAAYYSCEIDDIDDLKKEYKKTRMELYFMRNSINIDPETVNSTEADSMIPLIELHVWGPLYEEMVGKYVDKMEWVTEPEFAEYYQEFWEYYEDRVETYFVCTGVHSGWEAIADKWKELTDMFEQLKPSKEDKEEDFWEDIEKPKPPVGAKFSADSNIKNFLKKEVDTKTEEVEEPSGEYESTDIVSVFDEYVYELESYSSDLTEAEMLGQYKLLYGAGGAEISEDFVLKLEYLDEVLTTTSQPVIKEIKKQTNKISKRQCGD